MLIMMSIIFVIVPTHHQAVSVDEIPVEQEPGTYPFELSYTDEHGNKKTREIKWTLKYPYTVISYEHQEAIDARDLVISSEEEIELTAQSLVQMMQASAWSIQDGAGIEIAHVDISPKGNSKDAYSVSFSTHNGTTTTVTLKRLTGNVLNLNEMYLYETGELGVSQFARQFLLSFSFLLPILCFIMMYLRLYVQTRKVKAIVFRK